MAGRGLFVAFALVIVAAFVATTATFLFGAP